MYFIVSALATERMQHPKTPMFGVACELAPPGSVAYSFCSISEETEGFMRKVAFRAGIAAVVLAMALSFGYFRASGQESNTADPIFGTWKMDVTKSVNNRGGNHQLYAYQATRTLTCKDYPDTRSRTGDETLAHWRINPQMIIRLKKTKGVPSEWVIYTVSNDGTVFTSTSWVPTNPELEDLQVFTRGK
jgi:hypothetical protein